MKDNAMEQMLDAASLILKDGEVMEGKVILGNLKKIRKQLNGRRLKKGRVEYCHFFFNLNVARGCGYGWKYFLHIVLLRKPFHVLDFNGFG